MCIRDRHYLASEWNINKFTNNRFKNIKLNENANPISTDKIYSVTNKSFENCEIINISDLKNIVENIYALYPAVGENFDFIQNNNLKNIKFLYRKLDQFSWQYCNKGFFNFKNYIPKIIAKFN